MAYVRGNAVDYDRLANEGLAGWSYPDVLPYFKRSEHFEEGGNLYHGGDGPWSVHRNHGDDEVFQAFVKAGEEIGYCANEDYNGEQQLGFSRQQHTIRQGRRVGNADAFLYPAIQRGNVRLQVDTLVQRIIIEAGKARGVEYVRNGKLERVFATSEVIVSAGTFNSPQLLMLSGIGPADHLRAVGIEPMVDLPGVGENLWDHPMIVTRWERKGTGQLRRELRLDRLAVSMLQAFLFGTGFAAGFPTSGTAFVKSSEDQVIPDLQLFCRDGSSTSREWFPIIKPPVPQSIGLNVAHIRPQSRGRVRLRSADPSQHVRIQNDFLSTDYDRRALREGFKLVRTLMESNAFAPFGGHSLSPPTNLESDEKIDAFVQKALTTIYHPAGTCRAGSSSSSVVDPQFRVRGVDGLRVIDASVIPNPIGGNINAAVTMFSEKAADIVRDRQPLPKAELPPAFARLTT
jgi:4-pyridoxate dehydrogenase